MTPNDPLAEAEALYVREEGRLANELTRVRAVLAQMRDKQRIPRNVDETQIPRLEPGKYKGKKLSPALEAYLRDRRGLKIPLKRAVEDMVLSGATLGESHTPEHQLKIVISRNPRFVESDSHNQTLWLAESALLPPKKRVRKKN